MRALTYHERSQLIEELAKQGRSYHGSTAELCRRSQRALQGRRSDFGLQQRLGRNVARLQGLIGQDNLESFDRNFLVGALCYVAKSDATEMALRSALLVTDLALSRPDEPSVIPHGYSPWPLSPDLTAKAETLFLEYYDHPLLPDHALTKASKKRRDELSWLGTSGFFGRFCRDLQFLETILASPESSSEHQGWARAALSYLHQEDDILNDQLGLLGLCDDALVAALAADLIEPGRQPWQHLFDRLHAEWHFLDRLIIHDEQGGQPCSEFLLAMLSLVCPSLRNSDRPPLTALVLPRAHSLPLVLATVATLGEIEKYAVANNLSPRPFRPGDTICVDGSSYAHYDGLKEFDGQPPSYVLRFKDDRSRYLPMSQRFRLRLAKPRSQPSGRANTTLASSELPVESIEYLLDLDPSTVTDIGVLTLLASPVMRTEHQARTVSFNGMALSDTIPVASWTGVRWREWSQHFVCEPPLLGVTGDLLVAADLLDHHPETRLLIADLTGIRGKQPQALRRISRTEVPILAICLESDTDTLQRLHEHEFDFWEWTHQDLSEVIATSNATITGGPVARCEKAVRRTLTAGQPEVIPVEAVSSVAAYDRLQELQKLSTDQAQDAPRELTESLLKLQNVFFTLLRTLPDEADSKAIEGTLEGLERKVKAAMYLQPGEQKKVLDTVSAMRSLAAEIEDGVPRLEQLSSLVEEQSSFNIIVRDHRLAARLTRLIEAKASVTPAVEANSLATDTPMIVLGWHGRKRMSKILIPPASDSLSFLLYPVEIQWFELTQRYLREARTTRQSWQDREALFTVDVDWPDRLQPSEPPASQSTPHRLQQIDWYETGARREDALRERASHAGSSDVVDAHLVLFSEGCHAFLTPDRKVALATDTVLKGEVGEGLAEIPAGELADGDLIVLPRSADRDLLREKADTMLPEGVRQCAALWRQALRRFCEREDLDSRMLRERLDEAGCSRHHVTISSWIGDDDRIGPQNYQDIDIIASLTQDAELTASIDDCKWAIGEVRSAHLRAAQELAEAVLVSLAREIAEGSPLRAADLDAEATILEIEHFDGESVEVAHSLVNRLLEPER